MPRTKEFKPTLKRLTEKTSSPVDPELYNFSPDPQMDQILKEIKAESKNKKPGLKWWQIIKEKKNRVSPRVQEQGNRSAKVESAKERKERIADIFCIGKTRSLHGHTQKPLTDDTTEELDKLLQCKRKPLKTVKKESKQQYVFERVNEMQDTLDDFMANRRK